MSTATARQFAGTHRPVGAGRRRASQGRPSPRAAGYDNVITCDLGGTSFDVSVMAGGKAALAAQTTMDFGLVIRTPMIEITTIGAGGGSIASVDRGGLLQVGPESAGSVPGPACYGARQRPADARPTRMWCSAASMRRVRSAASLKALDVEAARKRAIPTHVAEPLKLNVDEGGGGDRPGRRGAHGRRDPAGLDRARPRSGEVCRHAVRRRWRAARQRADHVRSA